MPLTTSKLYLLIVLEPPLVLLATAGTTSILHLLIALFTILVILVILVLSILLGLLVLLILLVYSSFNYSYTNRIRFRKLAIL